MSTKELKLNPPIRVDRHEVAVFDFEPLWDRRHVFKHVLDPAQQWNAYYGSINLTAFRNHLMQIGCGGYRGEKDEMDMHGPGCPDFQECDKILGDLYPTYRNLIIEAIREGAYEKAPRHTHNFAKKGTMKPTNYFLSDKGVLTETYEELGGNTIRFKTAYRVIPKGRMSPRGKWQEVQFVRAAQEEVCIRRRWSIREYHTRQRWCGS